MKLYETTVVILLLAILGIQVYGLVKIRESYPGTTTGEMPNPSDSSTGLGGIGLVFTEADPTTSQGYLVNNGQTVY
jgi:hypothetical protein